MFLTNVKLFGAALLALTLLGIGGTVLTYCALAENPKQPGTKKEESPQPPSKKDDALRKLLDERVEVAKDMLRARWEEFLAGRGTLDILLEASRDFTTAELERTDNRAERLAALEDHVKLHKKVEEVSQARFNAGRLSIADFKQTQYARLSAEIWLEREKAKQGKR